MAILIGFIRHYLVTGSLVEMTNIIDEHFGSNSLVAPPSLFVPETDLNLDAQNSKLIAVPDWTGHVANYLALYHNSLKAVMRSYISSGRLYI